MPSQPAQNPDPAAASGLRELDRRQEFHESRAPARPRETTRWYNELLRRYFRFYIPPGQRVLELGCGIGDLLAAVQPSRGLGIDFSPAAVALARQRHPHLEFAVADALKFDSDEKFDYVVMSDLVNDVDDVQALLDQTQRHCFQHTRLVINGFNNLWRPLLGLAERLGWKAPSLPQNWLSRADLVNLLHLAGWEIIKTDTRILWPLATPFLGPLLNGWFAPLLGHFCLSLFIVARPRPLPTAYREFTCSVVIPARNEAGNIEPAVRRLPELGRSMEIIFVEGHSTDETWNEIQRVQRQYSNRAIKAIKQTTSGKGAAVREAFELATGEVLFILDADLTVPPEDLPKFYHIIRSGAADFVNGVRLVYPMEDQAMRFMNMLGNKFFSLAFSWLLGQPLKDTLCGTKVLFRKDYRLIARNRAYFGDFDPFGDFDLLFGAAKLNLRILDLPVRYRARTYGTTNISRWRHGWLLLRMVAFAAGRLKFMRASRSQ